MSRKLLEILLWITFLTLVGAQKTTKNEGKGKDILVFMGCSSYSMRISMWPLIEALTDNGHRITFISAHEPKSGTSHPNVTDFTPKNLQKWFDDIQNDEDLDFFEMRKSGYMLPFWFIGLPEFGTTVCEEFYKDPEVTTWIKKSHFDLVIVDGFLNECGFGLAHIFQAKTILYGTCTVLPWSYDAYGIPDDSSTIPDMAFHFNQPLNLFKRVVTTASYVVWKILREWYYFPKLEEVSKKGLGVDSLPSFREMEKNTGLVLLTTHFSQEYARALPPNVVSIGGLALTGKRKPLPKDMEDFINKGKNGFIYVSFGTVAEFSKFGAESKEAFVKALLQFPDIQFIWKLSKDPGVELPANFYVSKWLPQEDLLAHPKIRAFITHSGLGSTNEAVYHGVPLVAFPQFGDQDFNADVIEAKGIGIQLEIVDLKPEDLQQAIKEILTNPKYKARMQQVSEQFRDRPMSAVQTALWWVEYVLRYDNTEFLRPANIDQSWWVRRQLDAWLVILLIIAAVVGIKIWVLRLLVRLMMRLVLGSSESKSRMGNKKEKRN